MKLEQVLNRAKRFGGAFQKEFDIGGETMGEAFRKGKEAKGQITEGTDFEERIGRHLLYQRVMENLGLANKRDMETRKKMGIGLEQGKTERLGQLGGALARDVVTDGTRSIWWLLNAAQATADVITQEVHKRANKRLYDGSLKKGDRDRSGALKLLSVPTGYAINSGLGLMTPFGGAEGYKAAVPSAEDPSKTDNVLAEIALKYFMGRTGNLLPYEEFKKVRPDVSPSEFGKYKAFKYDKKEDWNPVDDGKSSMLAGALKYTNEGIHGPEVQFLGRSLPVTTGVVPFVTSLAGSAMGVRGRRLGEGAVTRGVAGGVVGLGAGQIIGNAIEQERRRRNMVENELNGEL